MTTNHFLNKRILKLTLLDDSAVYYNYYKIDGLGFKMINNEGFINSRYSRVEDKMIVAQLDHAMEMDFNDFD